MPRCSEDLTTNEVDMNMKGKEIFHQCLDFTFKLNKYPKWPAKLQAMRQSVPFCRGPISNQSIYTVFE